MINNSVYPFTKIDYWVDGDLLGFIDIFPSDYISEVDENLNEIYKQEYSNLRKKLNNGAERKVILKSIFEKLNVTFDEGDYIITGVEGDLNFFHVYDTSSIFPLKLIKFEDKLYPWPNDEKEYIKSLYGENYMTLPKNIKIHDFHARLLNTPNCNEKLLYHIDILRKVNENFK